MAVPVLMLGPGGDYVTRYEAVGSRLAKAKKVEPAMQQQMPGQEMDNPTSLAYQERQARDDQPRPPLNAAAHPQPATAKKTGRGQDVFERSSATAGTSASTYLGQPPIPTGTSTPSTPPALADALAIDALYGAQERLLTHLYDQLKRLAIPAWRRLARPALLKPSPPPTVFEPDPTGGFKFKEFGHESDAQTASHPQADSRSAHSPRLFADDAGIGRRIGRQQSHRLRTRRGTDQKRRLAATAQQGTLFGG